MANSFPRNSKVPFVKFFPFLSTTFVFIIAFSDTIIGNAISNSASAQYNTPTAHGSGVIYKSNGHILTNAHVVQGIKNITVVLNNGESYPAKVLYSDELADIAIVKIEKLGLTPISFADPATVISGKTIETR